MPMIITFTGKELPKIISNKISFMAGFGVGLIFLYFQLKAKFEQRSNGQTQVAKWRMLFLILFSSITLLFACYKFQIIENTILLSMMPFILLMIMGNYQPIIEQDTSEVFFVYLEDEEIRAKTQRFLGKITFILGFLGVICCFFIDGKISIILILVWSFLSIFLTYFYSKFLYNKKYSS